MGLVVMRQSKENKLTFTVDDSTGVIDSFIWSSKLNMISEAETKIRNSQFVKILGNFDYFKVHKLIEIEKICK